MDHDRLMFTILSFLTAAVVAVPLFRRFGLASMLGYLAAGSAIGPWGLRIAGDVKSTMSFAEFGVVFLLFIIGLELKPQRLWVLRKSIFGIGGAQVAITALILGTAACLFGLSPTAAVFVGLSLAFSSTAFTLQILAERRQLSTQFGRSAFAMLLFQDLAAIPLIAAIPLLALNSQAHDGNLWVSLAKVLAVFAGLILASRYLLRPIFRLMASTGTNEIFTAAALLLVLGVALLMEKIGLSMALGAFSAGVLLADSEYRHELEADIEPFKGLLLGLFFMAVGMTVDYGLLMAKPLLILALTLGLMITKSCIVYGIGMVIGLGREASRHLASVLPQGGEFAFVVFAAAVSANLMPAEDAGLLVVVVTLSMALTPVFVILNEKLFPKILGSAKKPFDTIEDNDNRVIIAGFGRVGQIVGRALRVSGINFTALEVDSEQVEVLRRFGQKVYYGDASKVELLRAAGAEKAKIFVLAIDDVAMSIKTAEVVRHHFPHLKILARARNRGHVFQFLDMGISRVWRETLGSSLEMAEALLFEFGMSDTDVRRTMIRFRAHDERMLIEQHKVHKDEAKLIDVSKQAAKSLSELLAADREQRPPDAKN
jgi:monovalent cation:proton antiporter-2 (CPA2) family protein